MNKEYRDDFSSIVGESSWTLKKIFIKIVIPLMIFFLAVSVVSGVFGWFNSATRVVKKEFSPEAMLIKYEWFKDCSAQLDKKKADIEVYKIRLDNMKLDYEGTKRKDWDRTDKEQFNLWNQEIAGVIASFNSLAAEYNSQMAKFNWRFANKGMLPEGANETLPREYKSYQYN